MDKPNIVCIVADNTMIVFTSDNGPEHRTRDGVSERAGRTRHFSMGLLRGVKCDIWEGGHRVPFAVSWPAAVPAGTRCDQPVSLSDRMATCADIPDGSLRPAVAETLAQQLKATRKGSLETCRRQQQADGA